MRKLTKNEQLEWLAKFYKNELIKLKKELENVQHELAKENKLERKQI